MDVNLMLLTFFMILVGLNVVVVSYKLDDLTKFIKKSMVEENLALCNYKLNNLIKLIKKIGEQK